MGMNVIAKELIKAWKQAGGIYKDAAEELEKEREEEEQENGRE
jgi:hypothetical protein